MSEGIRYVSYLNIYNTRTGETEKNELSVWLADSSPDAKANGRVCLTKEDIRRRIHFMEADILEQIDRRFDEY